jgi:hypothetical protein
MIPDKQLNAKPMEKIFHSVNTKKVFISQHTKAFFCVGRRKGNMSSSCKMIQFNATEIGSQTVIQWHQFTACTLTGLKSNATIRDKLIFHLTVNY